MKKKGRTNHMGKAIDAKIPKSLKEKLVRNFIINFKHHLLRAPQMLFKLDGKCE